VAGTPADSSKAASLSLGSDFDAERSETYSSPHDESKDASMDTSSILNVSTAVDNSVVNPSLLLSPKAQTSPLTKGVSGGDSSSSSSEEEGSDDDDDDDEGFAAAPANSNNSNNSNGYSNPFPTNAKPSAPITYTQDDVAYTLQLACSCGNFPLSVLLWGMHGAKGLNPMAVDEEGNNPLHYAVLCTKEEGNVAEVVDFIFQQTGGKDATGAKLIDSRNSDMETPLLRAATIGNMNMLKTLIRYGADLGSVDDNKNTVISNLSKSGHLWAIHFILSLCPRNVAESILGQYDVDDHTALDWACYKGHTNVAEYLMYRGLEPTHVDANGRNALHWAAKQGQAVTAAYLVALGMDPMVGDNDGNSPAMFARSNWSLYEAMMINPAAKCGYRAGATMGDDAMYKAVCCGVMQNHYIPSKETPGSFRGSLSEKVQKSLSGMDENPGLNPCHNRANPTRFNYLMFFACLTMSVWGVFVFLPWYGTPLTILFLLWFNNTAKSNVKRLEKQMSKKAGAVVKLDGPIPKILSANEAAIGFWFGCAMVFLGVSLTALALDVPGDNFSVSDIETNEYLSTFVFLAEAAKKTPYIFLAAFVCIIIMIISWVHLVFIQTDPGTVYTERSATYSELLEEVAQSGSAPDPRKWCATTLVKKPLRAKFDAPTGLLIARHDHYCIWLDAAVGFGNHRVFMVFVFFQVAAHYCFATFGWMNLVAYLEQQKHSDFCDVVQALASQRIWGMLVLTLVASLCALSLSILLFQQVGNIFSNITTNERINAKRYPWLLDDELKRFVNRFDTGSAWVNTMEFWSLSKDYKKTYDLPPVRANALCRDGCCEAQPMIEMTEGHGHDHGHDHGHSAENRV
jgi:hypothetical protein